MEWLTIKECSEQTGLSKARLRDYLAKGLFPGAGHFKKIGQSRSVWMIPKKDVEEFIKKDRPQGRPKNIE